MDDRKFFGLVAGAGLVIVAGFLVFLLLPGQWWQLIGLAIMFGAVLTTPVAIISSGDK